MSVITEHVWVWVLAPGVNRFEWFAHMEGCDEDGPHGRGATELEAVKDLAEKLYENTPEMREAGWVCGDGFPALLGSRPLKPGSNLYAKPDAWHDE